MPSSFAELLAVELLGNTILRWIIALLVVFGVMAGVAVLRRLAKYRPKGLEIRTNSILDDVPMVLARSTTGPIVVMLALYAGSLVLQLPDSAAVPLRSAAVILLLTQVGIWGNALIGRWAERYSEKNYENDAASVGTARLISVVARLGLFSLVLLLILDNIPGVEVTALVASLGVGGVAVALAVQNILGDLFASISIAVDKPFVVGDFIAVGTDMGTVEMIGLKTTRIRSLSGEELIFSNNDLLSSRVRNFQRMEQRRIVFTFCVAYDAPKEQLSRLPEAMRALVDANGQARFDRAHLLRFDELGYTYEVVYFVLTPDMGVYMDVQQAINLGLVDHFAANGLSFATLSEDAAMTTRMRNPERTN